MASEFYERTSIVTYSHWVGLFDPASLEERGQTIERLRSDPKLRHRMVSRGRPCVLEEFAYPAAAKLPIALFQDGNHG